MDAWYCFIRFFKIDFFRQSPQVFGTVLLHVRMRGRDAWSKPLLFSDCVMLPFQPVYSYAHRPLEVRLLRRRRSPTMIRTVSLRGLTLHVPWCHEAVPSPSDPLRCVGITRRNYLSRLALPVWMSGFFTLFVIPAPPDEPKIPSPLALSPPLPHSRSDSNRPAGGAGFRSTGFVGKELMVVSEGF